MTLALNDLTRVCAKVCVGVCVCVYTSPVSTQIYKIPEGQEEIIMERYLKWLCGLGIDVDGML